MRWERKRRKGWLGAGLLGSALLQPQWLLACAVCTGRTSDSKLADGANAGILALLMILGVVLAGFITFFVYLGRRAGSSNPSNKPLQSVA